jgi:nucleotide-binding universal stress UspA family protein
MGWNPKHVIAAVDGSEQSMVAARTAVDIARDVGAKLTFITVVRPPEGWWGLEGAPPSPEVLAEAIAGGREELNKLIASLDVADLAVETSEELGDPASKIIGLVEQTGADLLVVGRRGAGLVERVMLGSVADRLAHHAPCPLLIVP